MGVRYPWKQRNNHESGQGRQLVQITVVVAYDIWSGLLCYRDDVYWCCPV